MQSLCDNNEAELRINFGEKIYIEERWVALFQIQSKMWGVGFGSKKTQISVIKANIYIGAADCRV